MKLEYFTGKGFVGALALHVRKTVNFLIDSIPRFFLYLNLVVGLILIAMFAGVKSQNVTTVKPSTETAAIVDPFEEDVELRVAADTFCRFFLLSNPMGKIVLPYKPNWQVISFCGEFIL